jgi:hypothetical protein
MSLNPIAMFGWPVTANERVTISAAATVTSPRAIATVAAPPMELCGGGQIVHQNKSC